MPAFDLFDPQVVPRGIAVHMKTPFLEDLRLDEVSFERTARHSVDIGAAMIIVGQRGCETLQLSAEQRERSLEISLAVSHPHVPVLATATGASIPDIVATAKRYEQMGADTLSVLSPSWSASSKDNLTCLAAVAEAVSIPMFARCSDWGCTLSVEELAELPKRIPGVVYLKEEDTEWVRRIKALLALPGGKDYLGIMGGMIPPGIIAGYQAGARLFMCAADVTEVLMATFDAMEAGDIEEARRVERLHLPLSYFKSYVRGQYDNKMTLHRRGLFDHPRIALPAWHHGFEQLTDEEEEMLTSALRLLVPFFGKYPPRLD
ncbi:MAG: hypothetical protein CMJ18_12085 [Phycisphaeraceae bacterium]|nr:hypothetical protein [Phycisphaeraceae bacterium]